MCFQHPGYPVAFGAWTATSNPTEPQQSSSRAYNAGTSAARTRHRLIYFLGRQRRCHSHPAQKDGQNSPNFSAAGFETTPYPLQAVDSDCRMCPTWDAKEGCLRMTRRGNREGCLRIEGRKAMAMGTSRILHRKAAAKLQMASSVA